MKNNITNLDKQGKLHGLQIDYYSNGNIMCITNYHHGLWHGYRVSFNQDKTTYFKGYCNMDKLIYSENHYHNQTKINI